jgi:2',3'-cyclic-nucleotide 2'-phosphodiesterase (5'-nucleotidase family)
VHVNDLHANYQLDAQGVSPYARIRGYYEKVKSEAPYTIFTSAGDEYEKGALAEVLSEGASTRAILADMAFDVRVIGNHDYAWSEDELLRMSHDARASVLESNVTYTGTSTIGFGAKPFVALQIGCLKVGFAGMVSQPWNDQDQQVQENFYPDLQANYDFTGQAQAIVAAHRKEVDVLVFINHIGIVYDGILGLSAHGIDVILSGHSHDLTTMPQNSGAALVVQTGAFAEHVIRLDMTFDLKARKLSNTGFEVQDVTPALPPSAAMQTSIAGVLTQYAPHADDRVTVASAAGTAMSIATIAANAAIAKFGTDAAVVDTQTVWNLWTAGPISDQTMLDAFKIERELPGTPGFNSFYTATTTGAGIEAIRSGLGMRFIAVLPATTVPTQSYTLAIQKRPAYQPANWFPGLALTNVAFGSEAWEALDFYGKQRTTACLFLDVDQKPSPCP